MKKDKTNIPGSNNNENTSPTDIKGKDVHEANQTNSGAGGSPIKEGSNLLPEEKREKDEDKQDGKKEIDSMGTEVMQEEAYHKKKYGELPED
ncbi:hypothetical protein MG290_12260 [Flavobacterium sp. CBA20B-1]|uniref:hypothetical protein n=1 Tax=unclassified Flavobacterium TaxID=196869 RepID=UPI002224C54D|nr:MULTISPECIES: hypothetical protein [unclassified Flavobacterium]WCM41711.1 hypothetical protein MG290_12260 [Flavobacterium sp. CBA20B-1]